MAHNEAIKEGLFARMRVKKCYQSADRFERVYVLPALTTASVGILDYQCHGWEDRIQLNSTTIAAKDLLNAPANDCIPIVLGGSCNSGAYDLDLMKTPYSCSFGEAVLKSPAGGVAYFGGSRLTSGWPLYYFQRGEPRITKLTEMAGMRHYVLRSYHQGSDTLGQLYSDALYSFVANNKMAGHRINTQSMFPFILLGDPALRIPKQR